MLWMIDHRSIILLLIYVCLFATLGRNEMVEASSVKRIWFNFKQGLFISCNISLQQTESVLKYILYVEDISVNPIYTCCSAVN